MARVRTFRAPRPPSGRPPPPPPPEPAPLTQTEVDKLVAEGLIRERAGGFIFDPSIPESVRAQLRGPKTQAAISGSFSRIPKPELAPGESIVGGTLDVARSGRILGGKFLIEKEIPLSVAPTKAEEISRIERDIQQIRESRVAGLELIERGEVLKGTAIVGAAGLARFGVGFARIPVGLVTEPKKTVVETAKGVHFLATTLFSVPTLKEFRGEVPKKERGILPIARGLKASLADDPGLFFEIAGETVLLSAVGTGIAKGVSKVKAARTVPVVERIVSVGEAEIISTSKKGFGIAAADVDITVSLGKGKQVTGAFRTEELFTTTLKKGGVEFKSVGEIFTTKGKKIAEFTRGPSTIKRTEFLLDSKPAFAERAAIPTTITTGKKTTTLLDEIASFELAKDVRKTVRIGEGFQTTGISFVEAKVQLEKAVIKISKEGKVIAIPKGKLEVIQFTERGWAGLPVVLPQAETGLFGTAVRPPFKVKGKRIPSVGKKLAKIEPALESVLVTPKLSPEVIKKIVPAPSIKTKTVILPSPELFALPVVAKKVSVRRVAIPAEKVRPVVKVRPSIKTQQLSSVFSKVKVSPEQEIRALQIPIGKVGVSPITETIQKPVSKQKILQTPISIPETIPQEKIVPAPFISPFGPPIPSITPILPAFFGPERKPKVPKLGRMVKPRQPRAFRPSVAASVFGITGKPSKVGTLTGLGLRPLRKKKKKKKGSLSSIFR